MMWCGMVTQYLYPTVVSLLFAVEMLLWIIYTTKTSHANMRKYYV